MAVKKLANPLELKPHFHHSIKFKERQFKFTAKQKRFLNVFLDPANKILFVSGPAGSSKTYMSLYGCLRLMADDIERELLYVRSIAESADRGLGSLPGDITEKFNPFLMPLYDKLDEIVFEGDTAFLKQKGRISAVPINFMRGASWNNKLVICGDFMQSDINGKSGFKEMFDLFTDDISKENGILSFPFTQNDIVRSKILKFIVSKLESHKKV